MAPHVRSNPMGIIVDDLLLHSTAAEELLHAAAPEALPFISQNRTLAIL